MKLMLCDRDIPIELFNATMRSQFPVLCKQMTSEFSEISSNIGHILVIFEQIIESFSSISNKNNVQDNIMKCIKCCKDIMRKIQSQEKERLVLVSAVWMDECRLCINKLQHTADLSSGGNSTHIDRSATFTVQMGDNQVTELMPIETSLKHSVTQLHSIEESINELVEELIAEKHTLMEVYSDADAEV